MTKYGNNNNKNNNKPHPKSTEFMSNLPFKHWSMDQVLGQKIWITIQYGKDFWSIDITFKQKSVSVQIQIVHR